MRSSSRWMLLVLCLLAACTIRTVRPTDSAAADVRIFVPAGSVHIEGSSLLSEVWGIGVNVTESRTARDVLRALLFGPGVLSPSREMGCRAATGVVRCSPYDWGSSSRASSRTPTRFTVRRDQTWQLDRAALQTEGYRIDLAQGPRILGRVEFALAALPSVAGDTTFLVDPRGGAYSVYATSQGWVAWIPVDGRFSGQHAVTVAWYHDGRRVREAEGSFEGRFGTVDSTTHALSDAPVLELMPFQLGEMPAVPVNVGTYTALVIFDHRVVAGAWTVQIAAGPMVQRGSRVDMRFEVAGAEIFSPAFAAPGAFWGEIGNSTPDASLVADALSIAPALSPLPEPLAEPIVCAMATEARARAVLEGAASGGGRGAHGTRGADPATRMRSLAARHAEGCLAELVGPTYAPLLLAVP